MPQQRYPSLTSFRAEIHRAQHKINIHFYILDDCCNFWCRINSRVFSHLAAYYDCIATLCEDPMVVSNRLVAPE